MSAIVDWIKRAGVESFGIPALLNGISSFAASVDGSSPTVRGVEYVLLGINDLTRGEITPDVAKSQILGGLADIIPFEYLASFAQTDLGKKNVVVGAQSILSGVLGLAVGADDRGEAQRQIGSGIDLILFTGSPAEPPTVPVPPPPQA